MRITFLSILLTIFVSLTFGAHSKGAASTLPLDESAKMLPDRIGDFSARGKAQASESAIFKYRLPEDYKAVSEATRVYVSARGELIDIHLIKTGSDSGAYALLTTAGHIPSGFTKLEGVGTAAISTVEGIFFFKGPAFVSVYSRNKTSRNSEAALALARLFAETLEKGDGDIPVLVKHLPNWENADQRTTYSLTLHALQEAAGSHPVFEAINFEGGAEAVTSFYGEGQLVIIENTTPQLAGDNDARIKKRIEELIAQSQATPSAYQRVGNYSVFVFDAPNEQAAAQLIKSISYEQVVQWLGNNPRALERAQRQYTETTASIIVAVLKASGISILLCLGIGGLFGGLVFRRRRAQQAASAGYSDAGDMVRLNIDGMTAQNDPARLLGRGDG